jgi:hypothetical protein
VAIFQIYQESQMNLYVTTAFRPGAESRILGLNQRTSDEADGRQFAAALRVKRQMVYNYRDGRNVPSPEVIRRAMETWPGFSLSYRGKVLALQDFQRRPTLTTRKAVQLGLWEAIKKLDSESVEIEILGKDISSVQLGVRIRFRSGS